MNVLIAHPTGNEFFRTAAKGFNDADMLQSIYTCIASFPGTLSNTLAQFKFAQDIKRRNLDSSFKKKTHTHPLREMGRLISAKAGWYKLIQHETGIFSVDAVYKSLDRYVAKNLTKEKRRKLTSVYAYEDGAYYSFRKAKELKVHCLYDLPIGYWRSMHKLLEAEKKINPEWAITLDSFKDSPEKLNRKDEEIKMADVIFVASSFTAETLKEYPGKLPEVKIIPYGFPAAKEKKYPGFNRKIKLLFVGGLSQRKGLSYLFKAVDKFEKQITLTIVGQTINYPDILKANLKKHNWIKTLPHAQLLQLMRQHDVLIFPSLFEGFGQVITEAMAQGTPVITTERTVGPDIIRHDENGWLVKAGSVEDIVNIIEEILEQPSVISKVGEQALQAAKQRPWTKYGQDLAAAIGEIEKIIN